MNALLESNKAAVANTVIEIHNGNEYHFVPHVDWMICVKIVSTQEQGVCRLSSVYEDAIDTFDLTIGLSIIKGEEGKYTVSSDLDKTREYNGLGGLKLVETYGKTYFQTLVKKFTERGQSEEFETEDALLNAMFEQFQKKLRVSDRLMSEIKKVYVKGE